MLQEDSKVRVISRVCAMFRNAGNERFEPDIDNDKRGRILPR